MAKILLVGCNGLLGQNLLRARPAGGWEIHGVGKEPEPILPESLASYRSADIGKRDELEAVVRAVDPDRIFNAAAVTDVDLCEREPALAGLINRDTVGWMAAFGKPLVHVSTDYVFDGEAGPYAEDAPTRPLSVYGSTKLESEALALAGAPLSLVVRTMTLWGKGRGMKTSFVDFVRNSLAAGKTIRIVTDQFGNPTLAEDLASAIWKLVAGGRGGIYHVAGSEWNSRFDWARAIAAHYGLDASLIQPCLTADLKQAARRPLRSGLRIDKLIRDTDFTPRDVSGQLARVDAG
ncbi:MAG: SDR family oxidoreductase [Fibrobacteres bacterium]|nr:SDR family oxidoreductase [Fibrobacterota bacterium]